MVVAALGILKAGAAYVALDPAHPSGRLRFVIDDCGAEVIVTTESMAPRLSDSPAPLLLVETQVAELEPEQIALPPITTRPRAPAYIIYTSGSTGFPKGVLVPHRGLENLISWHRRTFAITAADRATQIASPAFDAAVWELWPYLTVGASICIPPEDVRANPGSLRDWLVAQRVTVTFLPTALAEAVMTLDWPRKTRLRYLLTGGDTLHRYPPPGLPFTVVNNYGPTEATVVTTSGAVRPRDPIGEPPSIGRPIGNIRAYIVDEKLTQVPAGTRGELLIGGPSVALGYVGQPALSAEKFIPDRFGSTPGARLYRTGDYVRERPDGELEFLGRIDEQVQIRGNRVELGEISASLCLHSSVRAAVVAVEQRAPREPRLIAYVVPHEAAPEREELRAHLAMQLPNYMVPGAFVYLDALPLTANGKVDRAQLTAPGAANSAPPPDASRAQSELEQVLEAIVADLLGLDRVGVDENFFMLGGHSLLGAQLISLISERLSVEMSLRSLFDGPTVAEMSAEVERLLVADLAAISDADATDLLTEESVTSNESRGDAPLV
jgi:amino acid adenylation domain-containing protein